MAWEASGPSHNRDCPISFPSITSLDGFESGHGFEIGRCEVKKLGRN